jgi:hypothetical protein
VLKVFYPAFAITAVVVAGAYYLQGAATAGIVLVLAVLEVSLSFDNAVVNATILQRMNEQWQKIFLTVGILIAVVGMRFVFPIAIVAVTSKLNPSKVIEMALNAPDDYAAALTAAHPAIAAFGGVFLLMIALDFFLEERECQWLGGVERLFAKLGGVDSLSIAIALTSIVVCSSLVDSEIASTVLLSGALGLITYLAVNGLAGFFEVEADPDDEETAGISGPSSAASGAIVTTAKASFFLFLYLEVVDASFSFDGAISAFAISNQIFVIAAGLGIGALYIRSMTVYLVRQGTLSEYRFLEHGAHYAIATLAVLMLTSLVSEIPEIVTGLTGVTLILASYLSSVSANRKEQLA